MVNSFLSLKRNRSNKGSSSSINVIFNKIIHGSFFTIKKPKKFNNDASFEHNRYNQQKQKRNQSSRSILLNPDQTQSAILVPCAKKSKHVRHYSHVSCISASNITVNSENLTAKEFAEIAGIRILSEEEEEEEQYRKKKCTFCKKSSVISNSHYTTVLSSTSIHAGHSSSNHSNSSSMTTHSNDTISTSGTSNSTTSNISPNSIKIWDSEFWKHPKKHNNDNNTTSNTNNNELPIMHELKSNIPSRHSDTYIKKGRFEITIGVDYQHHQHTNSMTTTSSSSVIEWKRKSSRNI